MPAALPLLHWPLLAAASGLAAALLIGFVPTAGLLLAGRLLGAGHQPLLRLILLANTLLLIGAGLFLLTWLCQLLPQLRSGDEYVQYALLNRLTGPYWVAYWGAVLGKGLLPQLLWLRRLRRSLGVGVGLAPFLLVDYWLPLVYLFLPRDYLPASWVMLRPDYWGLAVASVGYLVVLALGWLLYRVGASAARRQQM